MNLFQASSNDGQEMTSIWLERPPSLGEFVSHPNEPGRWRERPVTDLPGAYARAASMLMDGMVRSASEISGAGNALLPPYLYLWRHHLELRLKSILELMAQSSSEWEAATGLVLPADLFSEVLRQHSLQRLWNQVRPRAETVWERDEHLWCLPSMTPTVVSHLVSQLHTIDADGQGVRYDRDNGGKLTMLGVSRVDLEWTERHMRGIAKFLSWARSEIGAVMRVLPSEAENQAQRRDMWEAMGDDEDL